MLLEEMTADIPQADEVQHGSTLQEKLDVLDCHLYRPVVHKVQQHVHGAWFDTVNLNLKETVIRLTVHSLVVLSFC